MHDPFGPERAIVFCPPCAASHVAEVRLDADGFPITTWLEDHTRTETTEVRAIASRPRAGTYRDRDAELEKIADAAAEALEVALGAGLGPVADGVIDAALQVNDGEPQPACLDDDEG